MSTDLNLLNTDRPETPKMPFESQLTEQLGREANLPENKRDRSQSSTGLSAENRSATKSRSLSDAARFPASPSPGASNLARTTKDDSAVGKRTPETPQKVDRPAHLSLQLPPQIFERSGAATNRVPLSPKLDPSHIYASPVLPRRSRGLDFSRACSSLHLSTLAESSPDSSPVVGGRGLSIPQRRGTAGSSVLGSPNAAHNSHWPHPGHVERTGISSSVSSANMFDSDSSSSDEEDDESMHAIEREDPIVTTPHIIRAGNALSSPFTPTTNQSPGGEWMAGFSAAKPSLMNFQRARFRSGRSKHSSGSNSGNSSRLSSGPISPPVLKSVESSASNYFTKDMSMSEVKSRRESLSLGTGDLHLSDMSDDEARQDRISSPSSGSLGGSNPERRGVIRRPVTRRGNLLPKSKGFSRIRAALIEEGAPIDFEAKREAEVIRQVRENEPDLPPLSPSITSPTEPTASSHLLTGDTTLPAQASATSFSRQATKNSAGIDFWNAMDGRYRTPPPASRQPSGDDAVMQTPPLHGEIPSSCSSTPHIGPTRVAAEASRMGNKRRRDDDLDINSFKRRAVSPGMSSQNSPILPQLNVPKDNGRSLQFPKTSMPHTNGHGGYENGSVPAHAGPVKRIGLQGMNETSDGLMNMSID